MAGKGHAVLGKQTDVLQEAFLGAFRIRIPSFFKDAAANRIDLELLGRDLQLPIPRMSWDEAMERFGHDAPDLRFGMELKDVTDIAKEVDFRVFRAVADTKGGRVRGINVKNAADKFIKKDGKPLTITQGVRKIQLTQNDR